MRRQLGASTVDLDSEAGWVRFALSDPVQLDFLGLADVLESASYELHTIEVQLSGSVVGDAASRTFVVAQSGQKIPLDAKSETAQSDRVRGVVVGWDTGSPKMRLIEEPAPGGG